MMNTPGEVSLVEVGPRDGLQNESVMTSVDFRVELVERLAGCGFGALEVGSFVSPRWVPQMADTRQVLDTVRRSKDIALIALVPNMVGMNAAVEANVDRIAIFSAASESFSQKNTNCSIDESFERFEPVVECANENKIPVRGYVSCVLGCPYEGRMTEDKVIPVVERLFELGCYEVSLGDTIGVGTVTGTKNLLLELEKSVPLASIAVHFHDTYGQALPNILTALERGISTVDSSVGGLGGCPYAKGASGNVASEDVVYMLEGMGVKTGVDLDKLVDISKYVFDNLNRSPASRVANARLSG
ncbi:MAG: hydroxymethylglutaryl-CoA lyase [Acidiferrobacterales bacterium]|nr:hydroxymethylglutaryl-CoA lyase [Acidiferrobacterales bacterium]